MDGSTQGKAREKSKANPTTADPYCVHETPQKSTAFVFRHRGAPPAFGWGGVGWVTEGSPEERSGALDM